MATTFKDYGLILRRRKWTVALALAASLGLALTLNSMTRPVYRATGRIEIPRESSRSVLTGEMTQNPSFQTEQVALITAAEQITNRRLLERVAANLRPGILDPALRARGIDGQVDWLAARVSVEPIRDTRLINIHAEHTNPRSAEAVVDQVAREFAEHQTRERAEGSGTLVTYLEAQLDEVKQRIEGAERALIAGQSSDPFTMEKRLEQLTVTTGDLQRKLTTSNSGLARARQVYKELHPKLVVLEIENESLRQEIAAAEMEMRRINDVLQRYSLMQGELKTNRELHGMLLLKLKEAQIDGQMQTAVVEIVQAASAKPEPVRPRKALNIVVCLMAGFLAGVGLAFLREYLRHTVRTPDQITESLQLPVLGLIPKVSRS